MEEWGIKITKEKEEKEEIQKKGKTLFQIMYSSLDKRFKPSLEEKNKIQEYLFHNLLSNNEVTIQIALLFSTLNIPINKQYDFVRVVTPTMTIPYPKKNKEEIDESIINISKYYNCSIRIAKMYYELLKDNQEKLNNINNIYRNEGKVSKKCRI